MKRLGLMLVVALSPAYVGGFEALTDKQLDRITAGNQEGASRSEEALTRIPFRYSGKKGRVDGEVIVIPMAIAKQTASLLLMDSAQSNLRSFININAVNSPIQILMNLNVNVNSTIGNLNQLNQQLSAPRN